MDRRGLFLFFRILLLATLVYVCFGEMKPGGDGFYYYSYLPSIWFDRDLDFANEYARGAPWPHWKDPVTGRTANIFPIGTAILWTPFFLLAHVVTLAINVFASTPLPTNGFATQTYYPITLWGTVFWGSVTLFLAQRVLRRWFGSELSWGAILAVVAGTPFWAYWCIYPATSHVGSAFLVTLLLDLTLQDRHFRGKDFLIGLVLGSAVSVRPQNALLVFLLVPSVTARWRSWPSDGHRLRRMATSIVHGFVGLLLGCAPLLGSWKILFGQWLTLPQGSFFVHWTEPLLMEFLFSSRHGAFVWHPLLLACVAGLFVFARRIDGRVGSAFLFVYAAMLYVNACADDWWAGYSFGARRLVDLSVLPMIGLAALGKALEKRAAEDPRSFARAVAVVVLLPVVIVSAGLGAAQYGRIVPASAPVESLRLLTGGCEPWYRLVGNPIAWPASIPFALRYGKALWEWDLLAGRYWASGEGNMGDVIDLENPEHRRWIVSRGVGRGQPALSPDGPAGTGLVCRGELKLLVPLVRREQFLLKVLFRWDGPPRVGSRLGLVINGRPVESDVALTPGARVASWALSADILRRGFNEFELRADPHGLELAFYSLRLERLR